MSSSYRDDLFTTSANPNPNPHTHTWEHHWSNLPSGIRIAFCIFINQSRILTTSSVQQYIFPGFAKLESRVQDHENAIDKLVATEG